MISETTTSQAGLRKQSSSFKTANLFQNGIKADSGRISQYNFHQGGFAKIFWVNLPACLSIGNPELAEQFKNITEKGITAFDGIQNITADTADITGGIAGNSMKLVTGMKDNFDSFSIKVHEHFGQPLATALKYWGNGTKDPVTGWCTYNGLVNTKKWTYDPVYHTGELLYVSMDPTGAGTGVEYVCLITNIFPTNIPQDHLNMAHGEHNVTEYTLEFTGVKYESTYINKKGVDFVEKYQTVEHYLEFVTKNEITTSAS